MGGWRQWPSAGSDVCDLPSPSQMFNAPLATGRVRGFPGQEPRFATWDSCPRRVAETRAYSATDLGPLPAWIDLGPQVGSQKGAS